METNGNVKWNVNAAWIYLLSQVCKWENMERKVVVELHLYGIYKKCRKLKNQWIEDSSLESNNSKGKLTSPTWGLEFFLKIWSFTKWQTFSKTLELKWVFSWDTKPRCTQIQLQETQTTQPAFQINFFCRFTEVAKNIQDYTS